MPNPILNDKQFEEARSGWAAPSAPSPAARCGRRRARPAPVTDGPVTRWQRGDDGPWLDHGDRRAVHAADDHRHDRLPPDPRRRAAPRRQLGVLVPRPGDGRRDRRLRRRHRPVLQADLGEVPRPDLRHRPGLLRRGDLQGLREPLRRHRPAGRRRHARRVRRDARALQHPDHQGHRQVPAHRHLRHARHHGAVPGVVRASRCSAPRSRSSTSRR